MSFGFSAGGVGVGVGWIATACGVPAGVSAVWASSARGASVIACGVPAGVGDVWASSARGASGPASGFREAIDWAERSRFDDLENSVGPLVHLLAEEMFLIGFHVPIRIGDERAAIDDVGDMANVRARLLKHEILDFLRHSS